MKKRIQWYFLWMAPVKYFYLVTRSWFQVIHSGSKDIRRMFDLLLVRQIHKNMLISFRAERTQAAATRTPEKQRRISIKMDCHTASLLTDSRILFYGNCPCLLGCDMFIPGC